MTDKVQLIKKEIERLINDKTDGEHVAKADITAPKRSAYLDILKFIDSLPEEHNEDLKEEIESFWNSHDGSMNKFEYQRIVDCANHFAEWQKAQDQETIELAEDHAMFAGMEKMREEMMKDAVEAEVVEAEVVDGYKYIPHASLIVNKNAIGQLKTGDKVKIVIIKSEHQ